MSFDLKFNDIDTLIKQLKINSKDKFFKVQTSGTSSFQKNINVNLSNCIRHVKYSKEKRTWALCYPYGSFASTQVFFQSFLNLEKLVYCFGESYKRIIDLLIGEKITNLTCTPSFLNMILINSTKKISSIKSITVGGERLSINICKNYKSIFFNSKLINIYSSTETGSLLYSKDNYFQIPERYKELIKIVNDEIIFHKSLLNHAKENKVENDWFYSGDIVKNLNKNTFEFISRKSSFLNTGGYKVNLDEIEEKINLTSGIIDAHVYGKENSILGTIICADIVSNYKSVKEIKLILNNKLDKYKVPKIINIVKEIKLEKSGKKSKWTK